MRKLTLLAAALALGATAWGVLRAPSARPPAPVPISSANADPLPQSKRSETAASLTRDLLRYQIDPEPRPVVPSADRAPLPEPPAPVSLPPAERLVGFVRRGGQLLAALSLPSGETVVWGLGPQAAGYNVLAIDEERVARLRRPDGTEVTLAAP